MKRIIEQNRGVGLVFTFAKRRLHTYLLIPVALCLVGSTSPGPARAPVITLYYATAETSTSAEVYWNTNIASDSLLQYSTINPVPAQAPQIYLPAEVTLHEISLSGLTPATQYFYKITSCTRRGCTSATGSFDTFPICPDEVPTVSGDWQKVTSPNVSDLVNNELLGVVALSLTDVWSVGWAQDPKGPQYVKRTLIEHFNGSSWNIVASPNPANDTTSILHSVSASATNDVWAVGSSHNGSLPSRTLIQHWDGTRWSNVSSPSPDTQLNELRGVVALSERDVWAVGFRGGTNSETPLETLILRWDGENWGQVASPNIPVGANQLWGVAAVSANDIWAIGSAGGGPLALHWNGNIWNVVPVQLGSGLSSERLTGISGIAGNDVWVVGEGKGIFSNQTFGTIRHWDGTRWTEKVCRAASSSNPPDGYEGGGPDAYFTGIAAAAANDVWAVGVRGSGPMILHWNGDAWTTVTHPRAFPNSAALRAVTALSGGSAWTVGLEVEVRPDSSVSPQRTLIDRYAP